MMPSLMNRYKDFSAPSATGSFQTDSVNQAQEDVELAAFEKGYQAGWDDAVKACESDSDKAMASIAQRLQDMSFTHHEAFTKMNIAMRPLMTQIVNNLLPEIAQKTLSAHVIEKINGLVEERAATAIEIAVAPENMPRFREMLSAQGPLPFDLSAESTLSAGQVYLRANKSEFEINLDVVVAGIGDAFDAFYEETMEQKIDE